MTSNDFLSQAGLAARIALRDLRGLRGAKGLRIFMACVAIGVAAIVGVGALSESLAVSFARQGRTLIGGDVSVSRGQRPLSAPEREFLARFGKVSEIAVMRAMARAPNGDPALVEIKAIDAAYPLDGALKIDPPPQNLESGPESGLARRQDVYGLYADAALLDRLSVKVGDILMIGAQAFAIAGEIISEPDRIALGVGFGPRVMLSRAGLEASGLAESMTLVRWSARVAAGAGASDAEIGGIAEEIAKKFPDSGWEIRTRQNASPQLSRNIARFTQFMALIGLASLIVGGIGVAGAVQAFVARKRESLAILKALGARGALAFLIVLFEMMAIALLGAVIGALIGSSAPFAAAAMIDPAQFPFIPVISPGAIFSGLALGLWTALAFVIAPAGRAHDAPTTALFRSGVGERPIRLRRLYLILSLAAFAALIGAVYVAALDKKIALAALAGVCVSALSLRGVAMGISFLAGWAARQNWPMAVRMALANLHRSEAPTASFVAALGLGLTLLVVIVGVEGALQSQLAGGAGARAPDFFFIDVRAAQAEAFAAFLKDLRPNADIEQAPMLRGRIVKIGAQSTDQMRLGADNNAAWALEGDRGVTFAATPPTGSRVLAGQWWPPDYKGAPLVSVDEEIARGLGLKIGDNLTVNVAGRAIEARIASLRRIDWRSFGINFVLVFSPNTFAGAPHATLFTLSSHSPQTPQNAPPKASARDDGDHGARGEEKSEIMRDGALLRAVANAYPGVTSVGVRAALESLMGFVDKIARAARGLAGVAILAAALVLAGAIAAGHRARLYDAVILRALGATRRRVYLIHGVEFLILGLATSLFSALAGGLLADLIVTRVMRLDFVWSASGALTAALAGALVSIPLGLGAAALALRGKPAKILREL